MTHFFTANAAVLLASLFLSETTSAQNSAPPISSPVPPVRLLQPEFPPSVPLPVEPSTEEANNSTPQTGGEATNDQTNDPSIAAPRQSVDQPPVRPTVTSRSRRRVRLARAPNMFGDFFNQPPTLSFDLPLISFPANGGEGSEFPEILNPTSGAIQNPMLGGGPRLKISDNFSPIPRSRIFVQSHYFHNLFSATVEDINSGSTSGELNTRESVFVTTFGSEFLSEDEQTSLEVRLPLIHAPSTNNTLVDSLVGPVATQRSSSEPVGNLSLILKHVIAEEQDFLMSGGFGISLPTASDVTGTLGHVNYAVKNETLNLVPFIAILFSPAEDVFVQLHSQIDIPIGDDDFVFAEQPSDFLVAESGSFGGFRESINASFDIQTGYRLFAAPNAGLIQGLTAILELRYTTALNNSSVAAGSAGEFFGDPNTVVSAEISQPDSSLDYLNMTFGLQVDLSGEWYLRCGQVFPLFDNDSFTAETLVQLERRF